LRSRSIRLKRAVRVVADLDVAETAKLLGKSAGAVRVLTHRGLRNLARLLEGVTPWPGDSLTQAPAELQ